MVLLVVRGWVSVVIADVGGALLLGVAVGNLTSWGGKGNCVLPVLGMTDSGDGAGLGKSMVVNCPPLMDRDVLFSAASYEVVDAACP